MAAELPEELRARLAEAQASLKNLPLPVRWVKAEGIHLTFVFLGETEEARLEAITGALAVLEAGPPGPFSLAARGIGTFPPRGRPKVIWAGIEGDLLAAGRLKTALDAAFRPLGFQSEDRAFRPHLTLGRVTEGPATGDWRAPLERFGATDFGAFVVDACLLFESRLSPAGARYHALRRFPLPIDRATEERT